MASRISAALCAGLVSLFTAATLAPAASAGPAQRLARQRGISIREARQIINHRPMVAGPAAPGSTGGSVFVEPPSQGAVGPVVGQ
jgi:hypothetical protein